MATLAMEREVKEIILRELPGIVERDREVWEMILRLSQGRFADKQETESRFDRVLEELRRDREDQNRKWAKNDSRWDENQHAINRMIESVEALSRKQERTIAALGARWGLSSEQAFRNALKAILEKSFGVEVLNVTEYDDQGEVFGRPDQVELDVIIKDGVLILCEIKSSTSKPEMYTFERKVRFYEKRHGRKATRMLVISPMVDPRAWDAAKKLGIEVYTSEFDLPPAVFDPDPH